MKQKKFYKYQEINHINMFPSDPTGSLDDAEFLSKLTKQNSPFSLSNELIKSVNEHILINKKDFQKAILKK